MFIGRREELQELEARWTSGRYEVGIFRQYTEIDYYLFSRSGYSESLLNDPDPHLHLLTPALICQTS